MDTVVPFSNATLFDTHAGPPGNIPLCWWQPSDRLDPENPESDQDRIPGTGPERDVADNMAHGSADLKNQNHRKGELILKHREHVPAPGS